jgi:O-antigen/teichoic acid export membrane protein
VAGPDFDPSIGILRIQAIALMAVFVNVAWLYALLSLRRYRAILVLSLVGVTLNGVTVAIFGSLYGAKGAAWATTLVDVFQTILVGVALAMVSPQLRPSVARVPRVLAAAVPAAALVLLAGVPSLVLAALGGALYVVLVLVLGAVPDELLVEARKGARSLAAVRRRRRNT